MLRHRAHTLINIAGLSLGMACSFIILLYIADELRYDRFPGSDRVCRMYVSSPIINAQTEFAMTNARIGPVIAREVPEVEALVRIYQRSSGVQLVGPNGQASMEQRFQEPNMTYADSTFFDVFGLKLIKGDPKAALRTAGSVVLTPNTARKYFGDKDPIGQTLLLESKRPLKVTGVTDTFSCPSHLQFDLIAGFDNFYLDADSTVQVFLRNDWLFNPVSTYIRLRNGSTMSAAQQGINRVQQRYADERTRKTTLRLQSVQDIHLRSNLLGDPPGNSNILYVYLFGSVAVLLLIIAGINFVNLSTTLYLTRVREVALRKIHGASRGSVLRLFLFESLLPGIPAFLIALALVEIFIPQVNAVTAHHLRLGDHPWLVTSLPLIFLLVTFASGLYPSIFASAFPPLAAIRGRSGNRPAHYFARRLLVILQFTVSIVLITGAWFADRQMHLLIDSSPGFQKERMLAVPLFSQNQNDVLGGAIDGTLRARMNAFEDALLQNPAVEAVTLSSSLPGTGLVRALVVPEGHKPEDNIFAEDLCVDYNFIPTYKLQLIAGRDFSKTYGTDHLQAFILNESAVKEYGWTVQSALGKKFSMRGKNGTVVGVIKDFHTGSMMDVVGPTVLDVSVPSFTHFTVRLKPGSPTAQVNFVRSTWNKFFPEKIFESFFLEDALNNAYARENSLSSLMRWFAIIAVFISCLGLLGLASYLAVRRTREIGIRKVMGASPARIVFLLSREFLALLLVAGLIAVPLAWWLLRWWLGSFPLRVEIVPLPFVIAILITLFIAAVTVALTVLRAARANPVKTLRYE